MNNSRRKLSVVIITKNEEDKIESCLKNLEWIDEIVIVDDMSTDSTVEICRKYTNKIIRRKSNNNFDRQRNIGIDNASGDWILQMDADEVITKKAKERIKEVLDNPGDFAGFKFKRKNFFLGHFMKYGGWYHDFLRLFKGGGSGRYVGESIHETLKIDGKVGIIDADIEHYPFKSLSQFLERQNFYTSVDAKLMLKQKGASGKSEIRYNLTIRPLKLIWKSFIKKKGFKEGMYGFLFSVLNAWGHFLKWAKYWELLQKEEAHCIA